MGQVIVNYAKELGKNLPTAAAYTLKYGVAYQLQRRLFQTLKNSSFSLNIDKATSKTHKKVLSVLASYLGDEN